MIPISNENPSAQMKIYASEFASKITRKNVHGKLPAKTMVPGLAGGVKDDPKFASAFIDHGPDKIPLSNSGYTIFGDLLKKAIQTEYNKRWDKYGVPLTEFIYNQIVTTDNGVLTVFFCQDSKVDNGGNRTEAPLQSYIQMELPQETLEKLKEEIKLYPDLLEFVYQAAFPQLDSTDAIPGARRIKSKGFYLLNQTNAQDLKVLFEKIKQQPMQNLQNKEIKKYFESVSYSLYKNGPYGTGDSINE